MCRPTCLRMLAYTPSMHAYTVYTFLMRYYFLVLDWEATSQVHPYTPHLVPVSHTALCMFIRFMLHYALLFISYACLGSLA